jgi:competence protein ComEA
MAGRNRLVKAILEKPYLLTLGLAGILVVVAGLALVGFSLPRNNQPKVQIIESKPQESSLYVDVGGAVVNPGIYELAAGSRVNDALVASGGISAEADHDWVSHNLNLAKSLSDGEKVYVPFKDEALSKQSELVNINTASLAELDELWGIGPVTGQKIIDNRPYGKVEDLLDKKIIKSNIFEAIKAKVTIL